MHRLSTSVTILRLGPYLVVSLDFNFTVNWFLLILNRNCQSSHSPLLPSLLSSCFITHQWSNSFCGFVVPTSANVSDETDFSSYLPIPFIRVSGRSSSPRRRSSHFSRHHAVNDERGSGQRLVRI